jgi:hypothetical protein
VPLTDGWKRSFTKAIRFWWKEGGVWGVRERTLLNYYGPFALQRKKFVHLGMVQSRVTRG